ncbi:MAG TPA: ABC transporter permease [Fimbriiglobus sp.]|nr:ABC transporter permease [Fimbriiglobus sp.]
MISLRSLPLRSAAYHWRSNLPVLLGVAVGAAVLAGALIVGDSLRGSLRDRALRQLNGVESAYIGIRLIRDEVSGQLPGEVAPAMILQGSVRTNPDAGDPKRIGRVSVLGLTPEGFKRFDIEATPRVGQVVLSSRVAAELGVKPGEEVELGVERFSTVHRTSLLGRRGVEDVTASLEVEVREILRPDHPANDFSLVPNSSAPLNVFVPLDYLQNRLEQPDKINALLAFSGTTRVLNHALAEKLTPEDWGLRVAVAPKRKEYISVESEQLVLGPPSVAAVEKAAKAIGARSERTLVYLANAISLGMEPVPNNQTGDLTKLIPYSTVAALDPTAAPPLGPFLPPGVDGLADDEIALVDWPESPLKGLKPGDPITLTYFKPEMEAGFEEASATFKFKGYVPFTGPPDDPDLTPPFPGVTDKLTIREWNLPFELRRERIRSGDANERYWNRYKTTPKAYVTRAKGEQLWGSRFGTVTSVRVAPAPGMSLQQTADTLRAKLKETLDPSAAGLRFEPTRERMLEASKGGTDFAVLLLMFSWMLIAAALLLVGLLFRLAMERRAKEIGVLLAAGYSPKQVRRLLLLEGVAVAAVGALLGLALAVGYALLMIWVLTELWPSAEVGRFLRLHVNPLSLVVGFVASVLVATLTIWLSVRGLVKVPPPALLRGETAPAEAVVTKRIRPVFSWLWAVGLAAIGIGLLFGGTTRSNPDERSMSYFLGGGLLLVAGLLIARTQLRRNNRGTIGSHGTAGLVALGSRNAGRNTNRSILTATLIAFAAFLIVSVESFRRKPDEDFLKPTGGSGGFRLVAETDVPIFQRFDTGVGRDDLLDRLQEVYQRQEARNPGGPSRQERLDKASEALSAVKVVPFRLQGGDDASCLNLYQAGQPRVLGVPNELIDRGGFRFAQTEAETDAEQANPWLLLRKSYPDGAVPVFAEQNTAMFMLKTPVGGTLTLPDETGAPVTVRIVGTLQDSVFQSELLMSDANFRKLYPRQEGFRVFLIDTPPGREDEVANLLETGLSANGFTATRTTDRVASYQAVVGAYLTTFQLLGGFALLLAVLGLGVVVLRSVWERVGELALLRAVGYRTGALQTLILTETLLVLLIGLGVGVLAAVASVLPNYALGGSVPWARLVLLLGLVSAAGLVVAVLATAGVARAPLIPALRKD